MLPMLAGMAAGGALSAGVKGVQDLMSADQREKEAKRQALLNLTSKFQKDSTFAPVAPIPKAPSFGSTVVAPMAQAAVGGAMNAGIGSLSTPAKAAGAAAVDAAPSDPHGSYEQDFGSKIAPAVRPAVMPSDAEQDWYTNEARRRLGGS